MDTEKVNENRDCVCSEQSEQNRNEHPECVPLKTSFFKKSIKYKPKRLKPSIPYLVKHVIYVKFDSKRTYSIYVDYGKAYQYILMYLKLIQYIPKTPYEDMSESDKIAIEERAVKHFQDTVNSMLCD